MDTSTSKPLVTISVLQCSNPFSWPDMPCWWCGCLVVRARTGIAERMRLLYSGGHDHQGSHLPPHCQTIKVLTTQNHGLAGSNCQSRQPPPVCHSSICLDVAEKLGKYLQPLHFSSHLSKRVTLGLRSCQGLVII